MYLLDTNVVSELRRARPHGAVFSWIEQADAAELYLSAITLFELQYGVEKLRARDKRRAVEIAKWIDGLEATFNMLPANSRIARMLGLFMLGRPSHTIADAMIAATAKVHNLTVATRNVRDFEPFGVAVLNPFDFGRA